MGVNVNDAGAVVTWLPVLSVIITFAVGADRRTIEYASVAPPSVTPVAPPVSTIDTPALEVPEVAILKSSIANPSSAPVAPKSVQRIQKVVLGDTLKQGCKMLENATRFTAALPSSKPNVPVVTGATKSSVLTSVQVPVEKRCH